MSKKKEILSVIEKNSLVFSNVDKLFLFLSSKLEISVDQVKKIFYSLVANGDIYEIRRNKFITIPSHGFVKGEFFGTAKGFGFVKADGFKEDIFIPANKTLGALDGEKVIVKLLSQSNEGADGEVVSIYKELESLVGAINVVGGNYFLDPDNNKIPFDLPIVKTGLKIKQNMKQRMKL